MGKDKLTMTGAYKYEYLGAEIVATFRDHTGLNQKTVQAYEVGIGSGRWYRVASVQEAMDAIDWWRNRWDRGVMTCQWFCETSKALLELWGPMPDQGIVAREPVASPGIVLPIVHLNGSGKTNLLKDREDFREALLDAGEKLTRMSPNGRDYYVQSGLMEKADRQQERRMAILRGLIHEIETEMRAIDAE